MTAVFITATGTDIGKTFLTAGLIRHIRGAGGAVAAIKPIVSGFDPGAWQNSDPAMLLAALGRPVALEEVERISPWRIMVPLDDRRTVLDLMSVLRIPAILVAGTYVGTISHTLSALEVMARRNLDIAAVIVSESEGSAASLEETVATVERFADAIDVVGIPRLAPAVDDHAAFARVAGLLG